MEARDQREREREKAKTKGESNGLLKSYPRRKLESKERFSSKSKLLSASVRNLMMNLYSLWQNASKLDVGGLSEPLQEFVIKIHVIKLYIY